LSVAAVSVSVSVSGYEDDGEEGYATYASASMFGWDLRVQLGLRAAEPSK
jgi:hypothetical protein